MCLRINNILLKDKNVSVELHYLFHAFNDLLTELKEDNVNYYTGDKSDMINIGYRLIQKNKKYFKTATIEDAYTILKTKWGIASSDDLITLIEKHWKELRKAGYKDIDVINRQTNRGKKNTNMSSKQFFKLINKKAAKALKGVTRAVVCRGMYGNFGYRIYEINGAYKAGMINNIKRQFHEETGCPYYEVRPILYSTWINLPENLKYGTNC